MPTDLDECERTEIVVVGLGAVSPAGAGMSALWRAVDAARACTRECDRFSTEGFGSTQAGQLPAEVYAALAARAGECAGGSMLTEMIVAAAREALAGRRASGPERCGLFMATVMGQRPELTTSTLGRVETALDHRWNDTADIVSEAALLLGVDGPVKIVASGCSAGNDAVIAAARALRSGRCDLALAVGAEVLSEAVYGLFTSLGGLAPDVVRPFDANRAGMLPAEGAGAVLLTTREHATRVGYRPTARLTAWAQAADAYHPSAPDPQGRALAAVYEAVAARAAVPPAWVCMHGTGTRANDVVEATVIHEAARRTGTDPWLSSVKGSLGHAQGAAGVLEAAVAVRSLEAGRVPGNANLGSVDPALEGVRITPRDGVTCAVPSVVSTAFGFGGSVSAILLEEEPAWS